MKQKPQRFSVLLIILLLSSLIVFQASKINLRKSKESLMSAIPEDLNKIFKNSCMGCHAEGGKSMAMFHLNFSDWENYKPEKQAAKADAICKEITKGAMPPKAARKERPDAIPTKGQLESICNWSKSLNVSK
jgi:hypothetical protein